MQLTTFLCLILSGVICVSAKCPRNGEVESYLLSTHFRRFATPYDTISGSDLVACASRCSSAGAKCKSLAFARRRVGASICYLYDSNADEMSDSKIEPEQMTYYLEKICLKGSCNKLFVAESIQGMEIQGYDDLVLANSTRQSCIESCLQTKELVCRSLEFDAKTGQCRLSRHDRFDRKGNFRKSSASVEYMDVSCSYQPATDDPVSAEVVPLGNVAHPYSLIEYTGITAGECGQRCLRNSFFQCRSFLSGRVNGTLYCGLAHQTREWLAQNPGNLQTSRSLNYYELTRSVEGCDYGDLHFEMITGTVLNVNPYMVTSDRTPQQCLELCKRDRRCRSVGVDYRKGSCQYNSEAVGQSLDPKLQKNGNFNYFEKICLPGGSDCARDWAFERSRRRELIGIEHEKTLVDANTKEDCQAACMHYQPFACRSAEFNYELNECRLSPYSRFSSTEKTVTLSHSRTVVDYFENNCITETRGFCNTKSIKKLKLLLPEQIVKGESMEECRQHCYATDSFICRSVTFDPRFSSCGLSHHTRKSAPQESIARTENSEFLEISTCFDVSVDCEPDLMLARIRTNALFKGKVYAKGQPLTCSKDVRNSLEFTLPIPLTGPDCGTTTEGLKQPKHYDHILIFCASPATYNIQTFSGRRILASRVQTGYLSCCIIRMAVANNGTFSEEGKFSNVLVIQSNDHVVTALDKAVGVHCSYDVGNKTEETEINITDPNASDKTRGSPSLPDLSLHIVNMKGEEKDTVSLGELLRVQVRMSDEDTYGIFVRNLVAKDGEGGNNITLIDNSGCPVEVKMMREVRTIDPQSKSLEGYLEAFTFTGSSMLELEAEVETCLESCKPVLCQIPTGRRDDDIETVSSFGRKRRDLTDEEAAEVLNTVKLSKSVSVSAGEFELPQPLIKEENFAFPVTAPSPNNGQNDIFQMFGNAEPKDIFCFDPTIFTLVTAGLFCLEICGFSACLIGACRWGQDTKTKKKKRHLSIHYENSYADGSDMTTNSN